MAAKWRGRACAFRRRWLASVCVLRDYAGGRIDVRPRWFTGIGLTMYPNTYDIPIARLIARPMLSCTSITTVREAARRIFAERCSSIVVMNGTEAVGIWTEHDALSAGEDAHSLDRPIGDVMSSPVFTLGANTSLGEAAVSFKQSGVRHFVVVKDGLSIGVLSQTDIVLNQGAEFYLRLKSIESIRIHSPVTVPDHMEIGRAHV